MPLRGDYQKTAERTPRLSPPPGRQRSAWQDKLLSYSTLPIDFMYTYSRNAGRLRQFRLAVPSSPFRGIGRGQKAAGRHMRFAINLRRDLAKLGDADLAARLEQAWQDYHAADQLNAGKLWYSRRVPIRHPWQRWGCVQFFINPTLLRSFFPQ